MKKFVFVVAMVAGLNAFAQNNAVRMKAPAPESPLKGAYIGLDYMNLTDFRVDSEFKYQGKTYKSSDEYGGSLGIGGIRAGYSQIPEQGFGFLTGLRWGETFNRGEWGDQKLQIGILEGNGALALSSKIYGYIGLNYSAFLGSSQANDFKGDFGGQIGAGVRFTPNLALNAGYTMLRQNIKVSDSNSESELKARISGFNTNIVYVFN